ncbi:MAG: colicin transporter, partial [Pseudomonadota bacterium]
MRQTTGIGTAMEHIEELQARILAAMERISSGVNTLEAAGASSAGGDADLERALDEERTANAQLEERLKVLRGRLDEAELAAENATGGGADPAAMEALEAEVQLLRNEVGNTAERDALRLEVERLKGALEGAQNEAASSKEHCETMETENTRLKAELEAAMLSAEQAPAAPEVDADALNAEIAQLKSDLDAERQAATQAAEAAADAAQQQATQHANELAAAQEAAQQAVAQAAEQAAEQAASAQ